MNAVRVIDTFRRIAPLGVKLQDVATGAIIASPLVVEASAKGSLPVKLSRNSANVWIASRLPGLRDSDLDPDAGSVRPRVYALEVYDSSGQFLPLALDITLSHAGLYSWDGWDALPQSLLDPLRRTLGGAPCPQALPLFSAPSRSTPAGSAEIRGQVRRADNGGPAAWTLITAEIAGSVRGIGLCDEEGRFALFMPWPRWPKAVLPPLSPPSSSAPITANSPPLSPSPAQPVGPVWEIVIRAWSSLLKPGEVPSLTAVMAQLSHNRTLLISSGSPPAQLAPQPMRFGQPLSLPPGLPGERPSSFLIMTTE